MAKEEVWKALEEASNPYLVINNLLNQHPEVKDKIERLKELKNKLKIANLVEEAKVTKRSTLFGLLDGKGNKLIVNGDSDTQLIVETVLEGYHLTSEILQDIEFIDKVTYTYTYIDNKGRFHRAGDMKLDISSVKLEAASRGRGYSLRMRSSIVQAQIAAKSSGEEVDALINLHFQKFAEPFFQYEQNNKTGWKINKGVLAEAFERHWENLHHSMDKSPTQFEKNTIGNDLESKGTRWWMYRLSSGSAAYYTGPDTMYAQVKNANASLIDNVNTVLNTMDALIKLFDKTIDIENLTNNLKRAFQASPDGENISTAIWDGLEEQEREEILEEVAEELNTSMNNVKITKTKNKILFDIINTV